MNDFSELEAELKQLRPRAASPELMSRVERALDEPITATATGGVLPRRQRSVNWFALGFGLAAAAALLMLARVSTDRPIATQPTVASIMTPAPRAVQKHASGPPLLAGPLACINLSARLEHSSQNWPRQIRHPAKYENLSRHFVPV